MYSEQILREEYNSTLSAVSAIAFSQAAFQLAFVQTVNLPIDEHDNTLLHIASRSGDVFSAWQLLEFGANPQIANKFQQRPLEVVFTGNAQVAEAITAGLSSHRDAMAEVMSRRLDLTGPLKKKSPEPVRSADTSRPAGITIGVISP